MTAQYFSVSPVHGDHPARRSTSSNGRDATSPARNASRHINERTALLQRLDQYRAIAAAALVDVFWQQASARLLPATDMTIEGIVKHLAWAEDRVVSGPAPRAGDARSMESVRSRRPGPLDTPDGR